VGGVLATGISAFFLFAIAGLNLAILRSVWQAFRRARAGLPRRGGASTCCSPRAGLARLLRPLFGLVSELAHGPARLPVRAGLRPATEVAILGLSANQGADHLALGTMLVLPALFAAGMALVDTSTA
jgi:high-affinity nickel-transport protein